MGSPEHKLKHLDFIQLTITRMAANSFLLKAWAVTLVAALFALAAKDSDQWFVYVAYLPVVAFWMLDGFYLHQERLYRALYDKVRATAEAEIDFDMSTAGLGTSTNSWISAIFSRTLVIFYGATIGVIVIVLLSVR